MPGGGTPAFMHADGVRCPVAIACWPGLLLVSLSAMELVTGRWVAWGIWGQRVYQLAVIAARVWGARLQAGEMNMGKLSS